MADTPQIHLEFEENCPDCGRPRADLPRPLPEIGDDFDWLIRDYDGFRLFMMEELMARFPQRDRWTPADMEVVLVEVLAAALDQLSDMMDRVAAEAFLETARQPSSVRRLLAMIGYDAPARGGYEDDPPDLPHPRTAGEKLEAQWLAHPRLMEWARQKGPGSITQQQRMVTTTDYARQLEDHPLVQRAQAQTVWGGSWQIIRVAVICRSGRLLDQAPEGDGPTIRAQLSAHVDQYRMAGQEVVLEDAVPVGIAMAISLTIGPAYFQSEIRHAAARVLGTGEGGFFAPGQQGFGQDLHAGDIFQVLLGLEGVDTVCLNRFKRVGRGWPDCSASGTIVLDGLETAVCDNAAGQPQRGYYTLTINGGRK